VLRSSINRKSWNNILRRLDYVIWMNYMGVPMNPGEQNKGQLHEFDDLVVITY